MRAPRVGWHHRTVQRNVSSTVVAVVGGEPLLVSRLGAPNVRVLTVADEDRSALERATAAWAEVKRSHRPYVVHDADPLAAVTDAWIDLYEGEGARGDLEVAAEAVRGAWRQRQVDLPDYYLVVDPAAMTPTRRHWYLGVLLEAAPHRVVPVEASPDAVLATIRQLRAGRWWPDVDRLLAQVIEVVPDRFAPATDAEATGQALIG